jgi:hypothetical protein
MAVIASSAVASAVTATKAGVMIPPAVSGE